MDSNVHGVIVSGEASESDDDEELFYGSNQVPSASVKEKQQVIQVAPKPPKRTRPNRYNSLLHQKLYDANVSLHRHLYSEYKAPISNCAVQISRLGTSVSAIRSMAVRTDSILNRSKRNVDLILEELSTINNEQLPKVRPRK